MKALILSLLVVLSTGLFAQDANDHCLTPEEQKLYEAVNKYRKSKGLKAIPLSKSLSYVAHEHVLDLENNLKEVTHAWSSCKYSGSNSKTWPCMWEKPAEMTDYKGNGYECAHGGVGGYVATAESSLKK